MISLILKAFLGCVALVFLAGCLVFYKKTRNRSRTEILNALKNAPVIRIFALVMSLILCIVYGAVYVLNLSRQANATVTLNYSEASEGQNTNETRYNMRQIVCDDVLQRTITKGGFEDITVSNLKDCLSVSPLVEGNSYSEDLYHISTEFSVQYSASNKTSKYPSETILQLLCSAYREYYFEHYVQDFPVEINDYDQETEYLDYIDKVSYLLKEADRVLYFMQGLQNINSSFISSDKSTFASIAAKVSQLQTTQINGYLYSFILENGISNDYTHYIARLKYLNKKNSLDINKFTSKYTLTNSGVAKYNTAMARVVYVPTWNSTGTKYYMGRTQIGVDVLSLDAADYSEQVVTIQKQIDENNLHISKFQHAAGNTTANKIIADAMVETIHKNILSLAEEARKISQEYYESRMNGCISATIYSSFSFKKMLNIFIFWVASYASIWLLATSSKLFRKNNGGTKK